MTKAEMPETYSGTTYKFAGKPTVNCSRCGQARNAIAVHRTEDGSRACIGCIRVGLPPLTRSVVLWAPAQEVASR